MSRLLAFGLAFLALAVCLPPARAAEAPPAAAPPGEAKGTPAVISMLPDVDGVYGGKVTFAKGAFPIVADGTEPQVQGLLRTTRPLPCRSCHSTGTIGKKASFTPSGLGLREPVVKRWDETCPKCGGYGDFYDPKFPTRLLLLVDRLAHVERGDLFTKLVALAEERLAPVFDVRDKSWATYRCQKIMGYRSVTYRDPNGHTRSRQVRSVIGLDTVPYRKESFYLDVAALVGQLWLEQKSQPPAGQAALVIGETSERAEVGGWVWMKMRAETPREPRKRPAAPAGPPTVKAGPAAIILCGTPNTSKVVEGRVVVGGLMLGTWAPSAGAAGPKPAPDQTVPVILAILTAAGR